MDSRRLETLLIAHDGATTPEEREALRAEIELLGADMAKATGERGIVDAVNRRPQYAFNKYRPEDMEEGDAAPAFKLSPNQVFLKKWLSPDTFNQGVLLFHGVGVGKSCSSIQIIENFKDMFRRPALVVLPKSLKGNYIRELGGVGKQCVGDTYRGADKRKTAALIRRRYEILSFGEFANQVLKAVKVRTPAESAEYIRMQYSNRVIVVDEIHNLRTKVEEEEAGTGAGADDDGDEDGEGVVDSDDGKQASEALLLLLENAVNVKLVLMSATPTYNSADEIRWLMSVMYTHAKNQAKVQEIQSLKLFPNSTATTLTKRARDELGAFAKRYVSFMTSNPFTFPARVYPDDANVLRPADYPRIDAITGAPITPEAQIKDGLVLVASRMGPYHKAKYLEAMSKSTKRVMSRPIQLSNIAFPEVKGAVMGNRDLTYWFEPASKGQYKYRGEPFLTKKKLGMYAPKMATMIDYIRKSAGVVLVYSRYIWSGVVPFAIALEHQGYARYNALPLVTGAGAEAGVKPNGLTYVILTSNELLSPESQRQSLIEKISSQENRDGDVIKVVLLTDVAAEGVDFKNTREVHIMEPWYNMKKIEQIIGRGVRNNALSYQPPAKRNCTIYHHVSHLGLGGEEGVETVDFRNYRLSYNKQRRIDAVECVLRQHALDCNLNKAAQTAKALPATITTSQGVEIRDFVATAPTTGLVPCDVVCKPDLDIQASSASVANRPQMVAYEVDHYAKRVKGLFATDASVRLTKAEIQGRLKATGELLDMALASLVSQKAPFRRGDRAGYLLRVGDTYVFQPLDIQDTKISVAERAAPKRSYINAVPLKMPVKEGVVAAGKLEKALATEHAKLAGLVFEADDDAVLWDMVVDRLPTDILMAVALAGPGKAAHDAMERGGYLHPYKGGGKVLYLPDTGSMKVVKAGVVDDLPTAYIQFVKPLLAARSVAALKADDAPGKVPGFVAYDKNGAPGLKLLNKPKGQGSFCEATATYTVEFMKNNIAALSGKIPTVSKAGLCLTYEYWLRKTSTKARPLFYNRVDHAYQKMNALKK